MRVRDAIQSRDHWSLLTLTFEHREWKRSRMDLLFRAGYDFWNALRRKLNDECGKIWYIQTWEIHKNHYPHCHTIISNENVAMHADKCYLSESAYGKCYYPWFKNWLQQTVQECGFGDQVHLMPVRHGAQMAGYLVKTAAELTGAGVKNQIPVNAPRNFRRLRASKFLLPKRRKNECYTGKLCKLPIDEIEIEDWQQDKDWLYYAKGERDFPELVTDPEP